MTTYLPGGGYPPFTLSSAGETYILTEDIVASGNAITITGDNIILDLNGHNITYDNHLPSGLQNGGFEIQGASSGIPACWDISLAPSSVRRSNYDRPFFGSWHFDFGPIGYGDQEIVSDWFYLPPNHDSIMLFYRKNAVNGRANIVHKFEIEHENSGVVAGFHSWDVSSMSFVSIPDSGSYRANLTYIDVQYSGWQSSQQYGIGDFVVPTTYNGASYKVTGVFIPISGATYICTDLITGVDIVNNTITFDEEVPANSTKVQLFSSNILPSGLYATSFYYIRNKSENTCQFSTTATSTVIDIINTGSGILSMVTESDSGTSGSTEPLWPTSLGEYVTDNNLIWKATTYNNSTSIAGWNSNSPYGIDDVVTPTISNKFAYIVSRIALSGILSGPIEPSWTPLTGNIDTYDRNIANSSIITFEQWPLVHGAIDEVTIVPMDTYGIDIDGSSAKIIDVSKSGTIIQGNNHGYDSTAIILSGGCVVSGINIIVNGSDTYAIFGNYSQDCIVDSCNIQQTSVAKLNRYQLGGVVTFINSNTENHIITNNNINSNCLSCIYLGDASGLIIDNNILHTKSTIVNHHAIISRLIEHTIITNNFIVGNPGQGIMVNSGHDVLISGNYVAVSSIYPGWEIGSYSFDAIRLNDYGATVPYIGNYNITVIDNEIDLFGNVSQDLDLSFDDLRINGICNVSVGPNVVIDSNIINAHRIDDRVSMEGLQPGSRAVGPTIYKNNTVISDDKILYLGHYASDHNSAIFLNNTFLKGDNPAVDFLTIQGKPSLASAKFVNVVFSGNILGDGVSLRSPSIYSWISYNYDVKHNLLVQAKDNSDLPLNNVYVEAYVSGNILIGSGTTGVDGYTDNIGLFEFELTGPSTYTEYNPYTIFATYNGSTQSGVIVLNSGIELMFEFDSGLPSSISRKFLVVGNIGMSYEEN